MSRKVGKIAIVTINGTGYPANPEGTEFNPGGYEREAVAADLNPNAGFHETPIPSELTLQPIARADLKAIKLNAITGADIVVEYDSGAKFKMANAFAKTPASKSGSDTHWSIEFSGDPAEALN